MLVASKTEYLPWEQSQNSLFRYKSKVYVPIDSVIHTEIMCANYDNPQEGYFGVKYTLELLHHKYY